MAKVAIERNYVIGCLARWAAEGRPTYEQMQDELEEFISRKAQRGEEQRTEPGKPTEASVIKAEEEWERKRAYYLDMQAAEKVFNIFKGTKHEIFLEYVYLRDPKDVFKRGEISNRITEVCAIIAFNDACKQKRGKSQESAKRYLADIRRMFCVERGISFGIFENILQNDTHTTKRRDKMVSSKVAGSENAG